MTSLQQRAAKRLNMLPARVVSGGNRAGATLGSAAQQAGDLFWRCAVECFKPVYARIDSRFSAAGQANSDKHDVLMSEAKRILQEHRNLIFECVLPMFFIRLRKKDEPISEADEHAHDYFCQNVFPVMIDTLKASLPLFISADEVETTGQAVSNLAEVQGKRLEAQLLNFAFEFKKVLTPQQIERKSE